MTDKDEAIKLLDKRYLGEPNEVLKKFVLVDRRYYEGTLALLKPRPCKTCGGSREVPKYDKKGWWRIGSKPCPHCKGTGEEPDGELDEQAKEIRQLKGRKAALIRYATHDSDCHKVSAIGVTNDCTCGLEQALNDCTGTGNESDTDTTAALKLYSKDPPLTIPFCQGLFRRAHERIKELEAKLNKKPDGEVGEFVAMCNKILDKANVDRDEARAGVLGIHPYALVVEALDRIDQVEQSNKDLAAEILCQNKARGDMLDGLREVEGLLDNLVKVEDDPKGWIKEALTKIRALTE